jgi:hypothetical protein
LFLVKTNQNITKTASEIHLPQKRYLQEGNNAQTPPLIIDHRFSPRRKSAPPPVMEPSAYRVPPALTESAPPSYRVTPALPFTLPPRCSPIEPPNSLVHLPPRSETKPETPPYPPPFGGMGCRHRRRTVAAAAWVG